MHAKTTTHAEVIVALVDMVPDIWIREGKRRDLIERHLVRIYSLMTLELLQLYSLDVNSKDSLLIVC